MIISILKEEGLPRGHLNIEVDDLFGELLDIEVAYQNVRNILGEGIKGDVFFNSHGDVYPKAIEPELNNFFQSGGGFMHIGGVPFEHAMFKKDNEWHEVITTLSDSRDGSKQGPHDEPFDVFRSKLGFTSYRLPFEESDISKYKIIFNEEITGVCGIENAAYDKAANLASSLQMRLLKPELELTDHRAYLARIRVRETLYAGSLVAPDGTEVSKALQYIKAWGNPYIKVQNTSLRPWVLFYADINEPLPKPLIESMCDWLKTQVFIKDIDLELASLHEGEKSRISAVLTCGLPSGWKIEAYTARVTKEMLLSREKPVYNKVNTDYTNTVQADIYVDYDESAIITAVKFCIYDDKGKLRDYMESGVCMWNPAALKNTAVLKTNGCYFNMDSDREKVESGWVHGTNWQDRHLFGFSFHNPNPLRLAADAMDMAETGLTFVRPHFFMPGWFRSVPGKIFEDEFADFYNSFEEGPLLSERHMRALEAHVTLFCSLGFVFMPSVYTNVGMCMGSPAHWMGTARLFVVRENIENQKQFANQIMERFGDVPAISWDLINEPDVSMDLAAQWLTEHKEIWGKTGHTVSIGTFGKHENLLMGESADWHSMHGKPWPCFHTGKPFLQQEAHYPTACDYDGENELEEQLNRAFANTIRDGGCSMMPWNWNMSYFNWRYRGGWVDFWDLHLGCCTHADGTPRRGKAVLKNWQTFLNNVSFDQSKHKQVLFVYPKTTLMGKGSFEYMDVLDKKNIPFVGINDRDFATTDISEAKLIIFPLYGLGYRDSTREKAMEYVRNGGVIWAHNENMSMDENGVTHNRFCVPEKSCRQNIGKGFIIWCLGWNIDVDPYGNFPDMVIFGRLLDELHISKLPVGKILLKNGEMTIVEKWTSGRRGCKYESITYEPYPDENETVCIKIMNEDNKLTKAWTDGSAVIMTDGYSFSSKKHMFFLRGNEGEYYLNGGDVTVNGKFNKISATLASNRSYYGEWKELARFEPIVKTPNEATFHLDGWKRMHWLKVIIA